METERAAILIQSYCRGYLARQVYAERLLLHIQKEEEEEMKIKERQQVEEGETLLIQRMQKRWRNGSASKKNSEGALADNGKFFQAKRYTKDTEIASEVRLPFIQHHWDSTSVQLSPAADFKAVSGDNFRLCYSIDLSESSSEEALTVSNVSLCSMDNSSYFHIEPDEVNNKKRMGGILVNGGTEHQIECNGGKEALEQCKSRHVMRSAEEQDRENSTTPPLEDTETVGTGNSLDSLPEKLTDTPTTCIRANNVQTTLTVCNPLTDMKRMVDYVPHDWQNYIIKNPTSLQKNLITMDTNQLKCLAHTLESNMYELSSILVDLLSERDELHDENDTLHNSIAILARKAQVFYHSKGKFSSD